MLVMLVGFAPPAVAHSSPGYSHDSSVGGTNSDWMASLPDSARISELSIPGTHDSMAFYGGDAAQTQSMSLPTQLSSGVRVLDIRVRHMNNGFALYHGPISQNADFGRDVMTPVNTFLEQHPDETVLMRVEGGVHAVHTTDEQHRNLRADV
jgi:1-phosphatidylinositol phosphodiesterase